MNKALPQKSRDNPVKNLFAFLFLCVFFSLPIFFGAGQCCLTGPVPGINRDRRWGKPAVLCLVAQSIRPFVPFVPGTGGVRPWDTCPARASEKRLRAC